MHSSVSDTISRPRSVRFVPFMVSSGGASIDRDARFEIFLHTRLMQRAAAHNLFDNRSSLLHKKASDRQTIEAGTIESPHRFARARDRRLAKQVERSIQKDRHAGYLAKLHKQLPKRSVCLFIDRLYSRKTVSKDRGGNRAAAALFDSAHRLNELG